MPLLMATLALTSCHCVSFRLDDIQDYYDHDGQMAVIKLFHDRNETLTVGIIGNALGQDRELVNFLQQHRNSLEFANHGWLHEDFSALSRNDQSRLINQTNSKVVALFGTKPVTFIPPFNRINDDTANAVDENGMVVISADMKGDHPAIDTFNNIYHLPVNANVSDYDEEKAYWKSFENGVVLADINKGIAKDGYAIIMLHPRDFVDSDYKVDPVKINQLQELITSLDSRGLRIVTVSELANIPTTPEFSTAYGLILGGGILMAPILYFRLVAKRRYNEVKK
jgi:peptidoglycan/xylan/chitin deacetylase (PgdA/CDA1 family)